MKSLKLTSKYGFRFSHEEQILKEAISLIIVCIVVEFEFEYRIVILVNKFSLDIKMDIP